MNEPCGSLAKEPQAELFGGRARHLSGPASLRALDLRLRGVEFIEQFAKSVINPPESTGMGFWSINPYVGCEFGCTYCYARFAHDYVRERRRAAPGGPSDPSAEPFEHRIFVKRHDDVLAALEHDLPRVRRRAARAGPQCLVIGTATDPYQPAERQFLVTRAVLQRLRREQGFHIGVITKSSLVYRDIDVITALAESHRVSIYISLISVDLRLIKLFEARSPMPHARLRALRRLTSAGLRAGLIVAPILPGITDTIPQVTALMRAARQVDAQFVYPSVLRLYPDARRRFLPLVMRHYPQIGARYRAAYASRCDAPQPYVAAIHARFRQIARRFGLRYTDGDSEQAADAVAAEDRQLNLW